jgi:hypothetical protein
MFTSPDGKISRAKGPDLLFFHYQVLKLDVECVSAATMVIGLYSSL